MDSKFQQGMAQLESLHCCRMSLSREVIHERGELRSMINLLGTVCVSAGPDQIGRGNTVTTHVPMYAVY